MLTSGMPRATMRGVSTWSLRALPLGLPVALISIYACGARSDLPVGKGPDELDAGPDGMDAGPIVQGKDCTEEGITYIYVVTSESELLRFNPPDAAFSAIGMVK